MKYLIYLLLTLLLLSCGDKLKDMAYQNLVLNYEKAKDTEKPINKRLMAFIKLKQNSHSLKLEKEHEITLYIKKNEVFFHNLLFKYLIEKIKANEEEMLYLSSYDYQIDEVILLKKTINVYSELPKKASNLKEIEKASNQLKNALIKIPANSEIKVIKKLTIFNHSWLEISTRENKKYYCNSDALKGISHLKDELKAKSIWMADYYVKNFGNKDSLIYFSYLIDECNLNVNRELTSKQQYIHKAVQRGSEAKYFFKFLLRRKANINKLTAYNRTPLDLAINNKAILYNINKKAKTKEEKDQEFKKQIEKKEKLIKSLIKNGAKTSKELTSKTPLIKSDD